MDHPWQSLDLPVGWEVKYDPGQKRCFFIDHKNKTTSWEDPRIKLWNEKQHSIDSRPAPSCAEDPQQENLTSRFPTARKETISLVLKSSHGDIDEACQMLKDMGYQEKTTLASENVFKTLTLLARPDTLSPKSSSSAPTNPVRPGSARSNSPLSSARKAKTCYSETNSTISNSSEEDKKKNDKRTKTHKHGQTKKKPERDKKESQIDVKMELLTNILPKTEQQIKNNGGVSSDQKKLMRYDGILEDDPSHQGHSARTFITLSLGPDKSLARGPDPNLRSGRSPTPRGHDSTLCCGPSPTNICGPQKELLKGPQACLLSADTT